MDKKTIYIVTPTRADIRAELALFREFLIASEKRNKLILGFSDAQPVANNRNRIARKFLESGADFLLMVDSDTVPTCNPLDLVERNRDIIGFPLPAWRVNDDEPLLWFPGPPNDSGLVEVEKVAGGCLLVARRVLEHPAMKDPFMDEWDSRGFRIEPEDTTFCLRAREAGFRVWCAMDRPCLHFQTVELYTVWQFLERTRRE